ncbi:choice-of-anchor C family protein [Nitrosopumilus adriaticus]|uniref:DUF642 domain-containing protein n=1 Tax=Nitrosopumilus adriaticus TaxID=1580092 RepID=A0A0D5C115_9ARCH|nr:choice-of-anchor C family protein [Nitrosopumilus adriaticus]AJW70263.1 conserved exported protein of unknown function [Nitrosopumilus adriaticus]
MTKTILSTIFLSTILLTSLIATAGLQTANATTNLVVNGSFEEDPTSICPTWFVILSAGSTVINGWTIDGTSIDWICTLWEASDDTKSIDLAGTPGPGKISQEIPTVVGATYDVSFDMAGNPTLCGDGNIKTMKVSVASYEDQIDFDITGKSNTNMGWETQTFSFVAESSTSTLSFESINDIYCGVALDNVSVIESVPPVTPVDIDIKPGSDVNPVNTKSKGVIPVAVYSTADFDATTIDPDTVVFGPNGAAESHGKAHIEDVNGDGLDDVVLHFKTQESGIAKGDTEATLTGATFDGTAIEGSDNIRTK